jgi:ADP-glucose pyrophosphorylase
VKNCNRIENTFIGANCKVSDSIVINSTLLGDHVIISSNSILREALLQDHTYVKDGANVTKSVLYKFSGVDIHGRVDSSFIGSGTSVAGGECR